jgi:hypothetical protein
MSPTVEQPQCRPKALICIGGSDEGSEPFALQQLFGQPFVFHQIKQLRRLGVTEIAVAVETVPPNLLALADRLAQDGEPITVLRNPAELAAFCPSGSALLLWSSDIWANDAVLKGLTCKTNNSIAVVAENLDNQAFERIDLHRRWAGLALIDGAIAARASDLAEGWSLDSALLRHSIQAGVADMPITEEALASGALRKLVGSQSLEDIGRLIGSAPAHATFVEKTISRIAQPLLPLLWSNDWARPIVEWAFPLLALLTVGFAFISYAEIAGIIAFIALLLYNFRGYVQRLEYVKAHWDGIGIVGHLLLMAALSSALIRVDIAPLDAAFLSIALSTCLFIASFGNPGKWLREFSPLLVSVTLLIASFTGYLALAVKLLLCMVLAAIGFANLRATDSTHS